MADLQAYIDELNKQYETALAANRARQAEVTSLYDQIINLAQTYASGEEARLEQTKKKDIASGMQTLVSAGLANTTRAATLGQRWESDIGATARADIGARKSEKISTALGQKAQFLTNIEDEYPDYSTIANLVMQAAQNPTSYKSVTPTYWTAADLNRRYKAL